MVVGVFDPPSADVFLPQRNEKIEVTQRKWHVGYCSQTVDCGLSTPDSRLLTPDSY